MPINKLMFAHMNEFMAPSHPLFPGCFATGKPTDFPSPDSGRGLRWAGGHKRNGETLVLSLLNESPDPLGRVTQLMAVSLLGVRPSGQTGDNDAALLRPPSLWGPAGPSEAPRSVITGREGVRWTSRWRVAEHGHTASGGQAVDPPSAPQGKQSL